MTEPIRIPIETTGHKPVEELGRLLDNLQRSVKALNTTRGGDALAELDKALTSTASTLSKMTALSKTSIGELRQLERELQAELEKLAAAVPAGVAKQSAATKERYAKQVSDIRTGGLSVLAEVEFQIQTLDKAYREVIRRPTGDAAAERTVDKQMRVNSQFNLETLKLEQENVKQQAALQSLKTRLLGENTSLQALKSRLLVEEEKLVLSKARLLQAEQAQALAQKALYASDTGSALILAQYKAQYEQEAALATLREKVLTTNGRLLEAREAQLLKQKALYASDDGSAQMLIGMRTHYTEESRLAEQRDRLLSIKTRQVQEEAAVIAKRKALYASDTGSDQMLKGMRDFYLSQGGISNYSNTSAEALLGINDQARRLPQYFDQAGAAASKIHPHLAHINDLLVNGHSLARGLASGFNAMWMTWGNILPLMAGAALSMSAMKSFKLGSEFQTSMFVISELAGTTKDQMGELVTKVLELGRSTQFGPVELAKGLEVLTLAGLKAGEALQALLPTLTFASAGGVDVNKAAETLVAIKTAYGYTATAFEGIGDIIAKTAADTMASVGSMSESFKTASVVAQQYRVSLEDTAMTLGMLAQIGIKGSMAGTSFRNMLTELNKGSGKAAEGVKALGATILDAGGNMRSMLDIMEEVSTGLITKTGAAQQRILQDISNERGAKALAAFQAAALKVINKNNPKLQEQVDILFKEGKALEANEKLVKAVHKAYAEMREKAAESIKDAAGFTFFANIEKELTSAGMLKGVAASLESAFVGAFNNSSSALYLMGERVRAIIESPAFREGLTTLTESVYSFGAGVVKATGFLIEHQVAVAYVVGGYLLYKAGAASLLTGLYMLATGQTALAIDIAATAGVMGVSTAAFVAGGVAAVALVGVLAYLAVTWKDVGAAAEEAGRKQLEASAKKTRTDVEALASQNAETLAKTKQKYTEEARYQQLVADGASATEARDKIIGESALDRIKEEFAARNRAVVAQENSEIVRSGGLKDSAEFYQDGANKRILETVAKSGELERKALAEQERATLAVVTQSRAKYQAEKDAATKANRLLSGIDPTGGYTGNFGKDGKGRKEKPQALGFSDLNKTYQSDLATTQKYYKDVQSTYDAAHTAGLIADSDYANAKSAIISMSEAKELAIIEQQQWYIRNAEVADVKRVQKSAQDVAKVHKDAAAELAVLANKSKEITSDAEQRKVNASFAELGSIKRIQDATEKKFELLKANEVVEEEMETRRNAAAALGGIRGTAELARIDAELKVQEKYNKVLEEASARMAELYILQAQLSSSPLVTKDSVTKLATVNTALSQIGDQIADIKANGLSAALTAGSRAANKVIRDDWKKTTDSISSMLVDALFEGAKEGKSAFVSLRDDLVSIFKNTVLRPRISAAMDAGVNAIMGSPEGGGVGNLIGSASGSFASSALGSLTLGGSTIAAIGSSVATGVSAGLAGTSLAPAIAAYNAAGMTGVASGLSTGSTVGSTLAAIPGWGWAAMAAMAAVALFGSNGDGHSRQSWGGAGVGIDPVRKTWLDNPDQSAKDNAAAESLVTALQDQYAKLAGSLGLTNKELLAGVFTSYHTGSESIMQVQGSIGGNLIDANAGIGADGRSMSQGSEKDFAAELAKRLDLLLVNALKVQPDLDSGILAKLNTATLDTASSVLAAVKAYSDFSAVLLNLPFENLKNLSFDAANSLVIAAGGLDKLGTSLTSYYDNFYTAEEKSAQTVKNIIKTLNNAGANLVDADIAGATKEQFRAALEGQNVSTAAGLKLYNALLSVSGAFAGLTTDTTAAADTAKTAADAAAALAKTNQGWQDQLDVLTGAQTERTIALRDATDDSTRALMQQMYALQDITATQDKYNGSLQDAAEFLSGALKDVSGYVDSLNATEQGLLSPKDQLTNAASQYTAQLEKAKSGDRDALSGITGYADQYINASKAFSGSGGATVGIIAGIKQALTGLPGQLSAEQFIVNAIEGTTKAVTDLGVQLSAAFAANDATAAINLIASSFASIDTDLDGLLTFGELQTALAGKATDAQLSALIAGVDVSGDGMISAIELQTASLAREFGASVMQLVAAGATEAAVLTALTGGFAILDRNTSGTLTFAELQTAFYGKATDAQLQSLITAVDLNSDGMISAIELQTAALLAKMTVSGTGGTAAPATTYKATDVVQAVQAYAATGATTAQTVATASTGYGVTSGALAQVAAAAVPTAEMTALVEYQRRIDATAVLSAADRDYVVAEATRRAQVSGTSPQAEFVKYLVSIGWNAGMGDKAMAWANGTTNAWATANGFPAFAQGINEVPYDMTARIHEGERIFPAADNRELMQRLSSPQQNNEALVAEIRRLSDKLEKIEANTRQDSDIKLTIITPDGRKLTEQTISQIKERSRRGELVIHAEGVK